MKIRLLCGETELPFSVMTKKFEDAGFTVPRGGMLPVHPNFAVDAHLDGLMNAQRILDEKALSVVGFIDSC